MAELKIIIILVLITYISDTSGLTATISPVAGLFSSNNLPASQQAFEGLAGSKGPDTLRTYNGRIILPSAEDSYSTALEICQNTSVTPDGQDHGVIALVDVRPTNGLCDTTCLLCNKHNLAHLSVGWEPIATMAENLYTFSYHPSPAMVSKAYATLIKTLGWDRFTILYEDDSSLIRLENIIGSWPHNKDPITFRQLIPGGQNRETFKYIIKTARISHHILDCEIENVPQYMHEIIQIENSTQYQSFILTNLDSHLIDLKTLVPEIRSNISTMFMTPTDPTKALDIGIDPGPGMKMETALTADALTHLEKAIKVMKMNETIEGDDGEHIEPRAPAPPALCFKDSASSEYDVWPWGEKLRTALLETKLTSGLTGNIEFNEEGKRINIVMHYAKIDSQNEFTYAGSWDSKTNVISQEQVPDRSHSQSEIRVISRKGLPYFDIVTNEDGEVTYRGFAVDLIKEIFDFINKEDKKDFKVTFREVVGYGNPIEGTKKWDGIIGELMDHTADLGICDLTITSERNAVVDFSVPFMTTGISMLFKERDPVVPDMFSFINPLSVDVWLYLATTYIVVSFIFLICARMSNLDWVNPHPCNRNPENLENIWSFYNCTWFAMGTIMTQGCDILPRGLGSRWIAGMWWFFAMIVTASYTANMSTFLSNSRRSNDIKNAKDLAAQTEVTYGAVYNASTYKFFEKSNDTVYAKIWQTMSSAKPTVFTNNNDKGKDRVANSKGNFAFFMESTAIKYYTERNCKLRMVGPPLDSKSYGIAMPKNFVHKPLVDRAILQLQESQKLKELETQWWKIEDKTENCTKSEDEEDDGSLQMKNTSGIFLVLGVGGILGFIIAIIDFLIHANKIAVKEKLTFKEAVISEWNASLNPRTLAKPAAPPRSAPPSSGSPSPQRERSTSRAVSVLRAATSFINFDEIY